MTRKRLVKLIMASGIQRNEAQRLACRNIRTFGSYSEMWKAPGFRLALGFSHIGTSMKKAAKLVSRAITENNSVGGRKIGSHD